MLIKKNTLPQKKAVNKILNKVDALGKIKDTKKDYEDPAEEQERPVKRRTKEAEITDVLDVDLEAELVGKDDSEPDPLLKKPTKPMGRPRLNPNETVKARRERERAANRAERARAAGVDPDELQVSTKTRDLMNSADELISSDLVVFDPTNPGERISQLGVRSQKTIIGKSSEQILQLVEHGHMEAANTLIYKKLLQSVVDSLPYMEMVIRKSKGRQGAYAYNSMISSIRELMTDIQQTQDRGRQGELLVERILIPVFLDIGMIMVQEFDTILQKIRRDPKIEPDQIEMYGRAMDDAQVRIGSQLQAKLKEVRDECRKFLQR